ncbi:phasin family protein [Parvularcula dongshanensis]|uniref:Phasin family protein n=1 Tax=Parvularcula dongshanensis TaxID=1173995 RepID=A0A840I2L3_9PROT|nr:phasin family protein [Parvularcula dongshanensis]MBB4659246.1 phasin family protein [Parvularcula dongshanensis]
MSATKKVADDATKTTQDATSSAAAAANDGVERLTQGMSKFGSLGQENMEAFMSSLTTMAKGFEKIGQENMAFAKSQMEAGSERMQTLAKAKSPQEFFETQSQIVRDAFEQQISQTNKVSDMMISTVREAAQPISKRYSVMVDTMQAR